MWPVPLHSPEICRLFPCPHFTVTCFSIFVHCAKYSLDFFNMEQQLIFITSDVTYYFPLLFLLGTVIQVLSLLDWFSDLKKKKRLTCSFSITFALFSGKFHLFFNPFFLVMLIFMCSLPPCVPLPLSLLPSLCVSLISWMITFIASCNCCMHTKS